MDKFQGLNSSYSTVTIPASGLVTVLQANPKRYAVTVTGEAVFGTQFWFVRFGGTGSIIHGVRPNQGMPIPAGAQNLPRTAEYRYLGQLMQQPLIAQGTPGSVVHAVEQSCDSPCSEIMQPEFRGKSLPWRGFEIVRDPNMPPQQMLPSNPNRVAITVSITVSPGQQTTFNFGEPKTANGNFRRFNLFTNYYNYANLGELVQQPLYIGGNASLSGFFAEIYAV